jgi:tetratricopeptide (TPR) repeat protein
VHYYRGEYEHVVDLATDALSVLPPDWVHEYFGMAVPPSVWCRVWQIMSLAKLGRFADAAKCEPEAIQLAEPTKHAHTIGFAQFAASMLHLLRGDWAKARVVTEQWMTTCLEIQTPSLLPWAVASAAWALAQTGEATEALSRVREAEELLDRQAAREIGQHRSWAYGALGRACLVLGRIDDARRFGHRSVESSMNLPGFKAYALQLLGDIESNPGWHDAESGVVHYAEALALAKLCGMRTLVAHCHFGLGKLYGRAGKPALARENLTVAMTIYRDLGMDFWLEQETYDELPR